LLNRPQNQYDAYADFILKTAASKDVSILDIGSGTWRLPQTIASKGFKRVVGLDFFSDEKLKIYSEQLQSSNVELASYKGNKIPFDDNAFDVVTSLCVFEHILTIEDTLKEIDRVLKPGGLIIIHAPNWSSPNVAFPALVHMLKKNERFWLFNNSLDVLLYPLRSLKWYFEVCFAKTPHFIYVYPRILNNQIAFKTADDDVVHVCQPLSFKKYFKRNGYKMLKYNRGFGTTLYTKVFNFILPSLASLNVIVAKKKN